MYPFIYLASQSPRRQELLKQIGIRFELLTPEFGEDTESLETPLENEKAQTYVKRVTLIKCEAAKNRWREKGIPWAPILSADTTVSLGGIPSAEILGKPIDEGDAYRMLKILSGKRHQVLTCVAVLHDIQETPVVFIQTSEVEFGTLSEQQIASYISSKEPFGKAGGYGIQGLGGALIRSIQGSYSGIMGLPLYETSQLLINLNVVCPLLANP